MAMSLTKSYCEQNLFRTIMNIIGHFSGNQKQYSEATDDLHTLAMLDIDCYSFPSTSKISQPSSHVGEPDKQLRRHF